MAVVSGSGSKVYISAALPATHNKAGFDALSWTEVTEITSIGEYGRQYEMITHTPIDKRVTQNIKGNYSEGTIAFGFASIPTDAGQELVLTASKDDDDYSFKVVRTDGVTDAFTGKITSFSPTVSGGAIISISAGIAINTEIIDIA